MTPEEVRTAWAVQIFSGLFFLAVALMCVGIIGVVCGVIKWGFDFPTRFLALLGVAGCVFFWFLLKTGKKKFE